MIFGQTQWISITTCYSHVYSEDDARRSKENGLG